MKKLVIVWIAVILALSLAGLSWAEEKAKKEEPVGCVWRLGGMVTAIDPQSKTISIHQETVHQDRVMKLRWTKKRPGNY